MKTLFTISVIFFLASAFMSDHTLRYKGIASDLRSGKFFYTEEHEEVPAGNKPGQTTITYKNAEGEVIVNKKIDYSKISFLPDFRQEDLRDGHLEAAMTKDGITTLELRKGFGKPIKKKSIRIPAPAVADGGFNCFVKSHWDELTDGKTIRFNFAVPSQLDYFSFRVYKTKSSKKSNNIVFKMEAESFLLRQILSPIILTYNPENKRLVQYEGISNISDEEGNNYNVKIVYPVIGP